jgi:anthranilate/para-aminobenzoate synthase component II
VLKWPSVHSVQFHPESVLSQYGYGYMQRMLESIGVL